MNNPVVLLIAAMDTKAEPANYLRETIENQGVKVILLDPGIRGEPEDRIDITRNQVAEAAGTKLQAVRDIGHEGEALAKMREGTANLTQDLHKQGQIDGVISLGGSMGTTVATAAMRSLPIGFPKLMISTMASGFTRPFVGSSDILMLHSIADVAGLNRVLRKVLHNGGTAIAGMVKAGGASPVDEKPLVAISSLGITEQACTVARQRLEEHGFEVMVFHANGSGGPNMDEVIRNGGVAAVLEMALIETVDHLGGGLFDAGPDRGRAAVETGTPTVIATGCIDVYAAGPLEDAKQRFPGRRYHQHNAAITAVRTDEGDLKRVAEHLGKINNDATGPLKIFVPLGGFSSHDSTEGHLYEPDLPPVFAKDLRESIDDRIPIEALPFHINDEAFAIAIADAVIEVAGRQVMFLSADDVGEILGLIDDSEVDELRLHTNNFDLLLRRKGDGSWVQQKQELAEAALTDLPDSTLENKKSVDDTAAQDPGTEHLVAIPTPLPGTFYRAPKPGAAPFVEIGDQVKENTVVAIIETMKLMNSVTANTSGTIVKICKEDAEFADQDSVLMFVEPS